MHHWPLLNPQTFLLIWLLLFLVWKNNCHPGVLQHAHYGKLGNVFQAQLQLGVHHFSIHSCSSQVSISNQRNKQKQLIQLPILSKPILFFKLSGKHPTTIILKTNQNTHHLSPLESPQLSNSPRSGHQECLHQDLRWPFETPQQLAPP